MSGLRITVPHTKGLDYHQWWFPGGWQGEGPTERRDAAGRAQGKRDGFFPEWFVLMCNNTECAGRAAIPVRVVLDIADAEDPMVGGVA